MSLFLVLVYLHFDHIFSFFSHSMSNKSLHEPRSATSYIPYIPGSKISNLGDNSNTLCSKTIGLTAHVRKTPTMRGTSGNRQPTTLQGFLRNISLCLHTDLASFLMRSCLFIFIDIDAMGKPPSGITVGNLAWFGSYGECQNLTGAHYCLASIKINITTGNKVSISNRFQTVQYR